MKKSSAIWIFFLFGAICHGQYNYDFNDNCKEAYLSIFSLRFEEGKALLEKEKEIHPDNNIPYLLDNYIYFLTVFIGEEEGEFEKLEGLKDDIVDRLKEGDESSPYYRYSLAQVYLQWAFARTKFKEYVTATFEINRAYRLLEENHEQHPEFLPSLINLGLLHTLIGTVPDNYNWIKKLVGVDGTIDQGINEILTVMDASMKQEQYAHYKAECVFYMSFIQMNLMTSKQKALDYLSLITKDTVVLKSPLSIYAISRIYMQNQMNDQAIDLLLSRPTGPEYFPFYFLDYTTGLAKLHRLDRDANKYLFKFAINFKGVNYIKDAYQKLAWYYLVNSDHEKYQFYLRKVELYGSTTVDADKQAQREAESKVVPNVVLLKSRLLFDGGYYEKALGVITESESVINLQNERDSLELTYRKGRIFDALGKPDQAIIYYKKTIENGAESEFYFAANSALKLAIIYEDREEFENAGYYYKKAQSMENEEYKNSINQKAKAGVQRIENRK
ncbi:MAG: hypothetical protein R2764_25180 [Bacteroidales bacterium]